MNAMTLLRGFSSIDPRYMEAALQGAAVSPQPASETAEASGGPHAARSRSSTPPLRYAGLGAAAACMLLASGVILHLHRQKEDVLFTASSQNDEIVEMTAGTTLTESETTVTSTDTAPAVPQTTAADATDTVPVQTETQMLIQNPETMQPPDSTASTVTTTETVTETTAAPVTYPAQVPVLAANGDQAGTLAKSVQISRISGADAVQRFLNGSDPVMTLGSGQKDAETVQRIMQSPELLRIRWQTDSGCWEEYGIESAVLGKDGILRMTVCMYTGAPDENPEPWVYETALIWDTGALPPIRDVQLDLQYYTETADPETGIPGITEWLAFDSRIQNDLAIEIQQ